MVLMVEMALMMIPMMPGVMVMMMTAIPPLREGNSTIDFSLPELFFSLSGFRLVEAAEKLLVDIPDVFRSRGINSPKGSRRGGHRGQGRAPPAARGGPVAWERPCPLELHSMPPFSTVTYSSKY